MGKASPNPPFAARFLPALPRPPLMTPVRSHVNHPSSPRYPQGPQMEMLMFKSSWIPNLLTQSSYYRLM